MDELGQGCERVRSSREVPAGKLASPGAGFEASDAETGAGAATTLP
jgi:hypothetical protein